MADHKLLGLSATLVLIGVVLVTIVVLFLHPGGAPTEEGVLANFAASSDWTAIHLGQFVGMAGIMAGLLVLFFALGETSGTPRWLGFFGAIAAGVALVLAALEFAVDGVANKQADVAWVSAPAAEKAARFASAEALRWLEWGTVSYLNFMLGLALVLFAIVIVWTARAPRPIGSLMGVSGLVFLVAGWLIGTTGFTPTDSVITSASFTLLLFNSAKTCLAEFLTHTHRRYIMANHKLLRLSATLLVIGLVVYIVMNFLHPAGGATEEARFATYAGSSDYAAIHLGELVGMAVLLAGLLVLFFALGETSGTPRWLGFFGAISTGVALALYSVQYAVDGVALKQATDAWVSAPEGEQATRLASAQAIRWLEWGITSYQNFTWGLAMVLFASVIVWTARVPRPIGSLMGVSGLAIIVAGWVVGVEGFTPTNTVGDLAGAVFLVAWIIWLLFVAWRRKETVQAAPA